MTRRRRRRLAWLGGGAIAAVAAVLLARGIRDLATTRGAVATYARLIAAANAGDLATVRGCCSTRYLADRPPTAAREGGVVGFPRQIHPNFRVWVDGAEVRLCAANRVGVVARFVREGGGWRYDGPAGLLRADGRVVPVSPPQGKFRGDIP